MKDFKNEDKPKKGFDELYPDLAKEEREENMRYVTQDKRNKKKGFLRSFFEDDFTPGF